MTLWLAVALMTVAAIFAVLWPLARPGGRLRPGGDVAVYRDQLDESGRDRAAGLIADREAAAAQAEVSRRLIGAADRQTPPAAASSVVWRRRAVAVVALVMLPFGAAALYLLLGSPALPDQPLAPRLVAAAPAHQSVDNLIPRGGA